MSTPTMLNWLVPGRSGTATVQLVTLVQVRGHSSPLSQMVLTFTGAAPLTYATSLLTWMVEFTMNGEAIFMSTCRMAFCAWESQDLILIEGFSTEKPLATKALYLASSNGPLTAVLRGPFISSCKARKYMRRKVGLLYILAVFG